jgi:hypothetical protein
MTSTARLLQYPPEIRNMIYETLFQREHAIELEPDYRYTHYMSSRFAPCVALLATYRQIKEEALGFLYSRNTFLFLSNLMDHFKRWIRNIGDNLALLRSIHINLGWDEDDHRYSEMGIEFILGEMWRRPSPKIGFSIYKEIGPETKTRVLALEPNNILQALGPRVSPHLKPLAYAQNLIRRILLETSGRHVRFIFDSRETYGSEHEPCIQYDLSVDGELRRASPSFPSPPPPNLVGILRMLDPYLAFGNFVENPSKSMTFDLDLHTLSTAWPAIIHVNESLRQQFVPLYYKSPNVHGGWHRKEVDSTVRTVSHESRATFHGFAALKS